MNIIDIIKNDIHIARRQQDSRLISILTTLFAECEKIGKDNGNRKTTDEECVRVVKKFITGIDESLQYINPVKEGLKDNLLYEKSIIELYLPAQLSEEDLRSHILRFISEIENFSQKDIGKIMGRLKTEFAGLYDGKLASQIIKELLA